MLLNDKSIIISGFGAGLGQALTIQAAQEGAKVVLAARNLDFLQEVVKLITAQNGEAVAIPCDVSDADQCQPWKLRRPKHLAQFMVW